MNNTERTDETMKALDTLKRVLLDTDAKAHREPSLDVMSDIQRNVDIMASLLHTVTLFQATGAEGVVK